MACMEHECPTCDHVEFNNRSTMICPKCGDAMLSYWDEADDDHGERDDFDDFDDDWEEVA